MASHDNRVRPPHGEDEVNPLLVVMNAREIPRSMEAFRSLEIPKVWLRAYPEEKLSGVLNQVVADSGFDPYILASDDLVPSPSGLNEVLEGLRRHEAFTGWCNISPSNLRGNVRTRQVPLRKAYLSLGLRYPRLENLTRRLKGLTFEEPSSWPEGDFRVYSTGYAFTGMSRDLWLQHPLFSFSHSDDLLAHSLEEGGVPMYSNRLAFFYHLASREGLLVGKTEPHVVWDQ